MANMGALAQIQRAATARQLRFVLIGGFAVNAHGYSRVTGDLDLAVPRNDRLEWRALIGDLGYRLVAENERFFQFQSMTGSGLPIDVMLANGSTFEAFWKEAKDTLADGTTFRVVALEHLIAMKLHVLKQAKLHRFMKDYQDVVSLVWLNGIDLASASYRALFEKYGTLDLYEKIRRACEAKQ